MEKRFFDTIQQFGGPKMQPLLEEVEGKNNEGEALLHYSTRTKKRGLY
jgi:hypothetical protein